MEKEIVKASGSVLIAKRAGIVEYVSGDKLLFVLLKVNLEMSMIGSLKVLIPII